MHLDSVADTGGGALRCPPFLQRGEGVSAERVKQLLEKRPRHGSHHSHARKGAHHHHPHPHHSHLTSRPQPGSMRVKMSSWKTHASRDRRDWSGCLLRQRVPSSSSSSATPSSPLSSCSSLCDCLSLPATPLLAPLLLPLTGTTVTPSTAAPRMLPLLLRNAPRRAYAPAVHLPPDVLSQVLMCFETRERVHSVSRVCRAWRKCSLDAAWRVHERDIRRDVTDAELGRIAGLNVECLVLKSKDAATRLLQAYRRQAGGTAAHRTPRELTLLADIEAEDWGALSALQERLSHLYVLTFRNTADGGLRFPRLRHLAARQVADAGGWECLPGSLTSLTITRFVSGKDLVEQLPRFRSLEDIKISTEFVPSGFRAIADHCRGLRKLDLSGTHVDSASLGAILANCGQLESLVVNGVDDGSRMGGGAPPPSPPSSIADILCTPCRSPLRLQHLFIKGMAGLTNKGLRRMLSQLTHLRSLKLNTNKDITDEGFVGAADDTDPCRIPMGLKSIQMSDCRHLTDRALVCMAVPNLTELSLFCCQRMTPEGMRVIAQNCRQLRALYLFIPRFEGSGSVSAAGEDSVVPVRRESSCTVVDDFVMRLIWDLPHLEAFRGFSCGALTAGAFPTTRRPKLRTLELDYSIALRSASDVTLTQLAIVTAFPNLQKLSLKSNEAVISDVRVIGSLLQMQYLVCLRVCLVSLEALRSIFSRKSIRILDADFFHCSALEYEKTYAPVACTELFTDGKPVFLPQGSPKPHSVVFREGEFFEGGTGRKLRFIFDKPCSV